MIGRTFIEHLQMVQDFLSIVQNPCKTNISTLPQSGSSQENKLLLIFIAKAM